MHDLKTSCLDLFAMAEDCCLRQERLKDSRYIQAQQQRALDPASAKRLQNLHQLVQVIGQSLQEADSVLDAQWEDHVSKEKKTRSVLLIYYVSHCSFRLVIYTLSGVFQFCNRFSKCSLWL